MCVLRTTGVAAGIFLLTTCLLEKSSYIQKNKHFEYQKFTPQSPLFHFLFRKKKLLNRRIFSPIEFSKCLAPKKILLDGFLFRRRPIHINVLMITNLTHSKSNTIFNDFKNYTPFPKPSKPLEIVSISNDLNSLILLHYHKNIGVYLFIKIQNSKSETRGKKKKITQKYNALFLHYFLRYIFLHYFFVTLFIIFLLISPLLEKKWKQK